MAGLSVRSLLPPSKSKAPTLSKRDPRTNQSGNLRCRNRRQDERTQRNLRACSKNECSQAIIQQCTPDLPTEPFATKAASQAQTLVRPRVNQASSLASTFDFLWLTQSASVALAALLGPLRGRDHSQNRRPKPRPAVQGATVSMLHTLSHQLPTELPLRHLA